MVRYQPVRTRAISSSQLLEGMLVDRLRVFALVAALILVGQLDDVPAAGGNQVPEADLIVKASCDKKAYSLGEPVFVSYSVSNASSAPVRANIDLDYASGFVTFEVLDSNDHRRKIESPVLQETGISEMILEPGLEISGNVQLSWGPTPLGRPFPQSGRYGLTVKVSVGLVGGAVVLSSPSIEIEVHEPSGPDVKAVKFFDSREDFFHLLETGPEEYCNGAAIPKACLDRLLDFLHENPQSNYVPLLHLWIAEAVLDRWLDLPERQELGITMLNDYWQKWPQNGLTPHVMFRLGTLLYHAGRRADAIALQEEFARRYPDKKVMLENLRKNLRMSP
jgi:hypothetical protein